VLMEVKAFALNVARKAHIVIKKGFYCVWNPHRYVNLRLHFFILQTISFLFDKSVLLHVV
jgi:hypothetical protein